LGVNDGNMEEGSLRCDANVSVRTARSTALGTKAEVKNLNSFRYLQKALEYEIARQVALVEGGGRVVQETRLWDQASQRTVTMRSKEEAHDYRYFPEPDLPPIEVTAAHIAEIDRSLPELPAARRARFIAQYGLPAYDAGELTRAREVADYFERAAAASGNAKAASNWIMGELSRWLNERGAGFDRVPIDAMRLAGLIALVDNGTINSSTAKEVFEKMCASDRTAAEIVAADGLAQISDEAAVLTIVRQVVEANQSAVAQFRAGKTNVFGFLVGQAMKATKGKASPALVNTLLRQEIERS
jgi:aspartyl-tRNA(Asn)/glutamyl-tRNA(Gln) amidotransferase subunit B